MDGSQSFTLYDSTWCRSLSLLAMRSSTSSGFRRSEMVAMRSSASYPSSSKTGSCGAAMASRMRSYCTCRSSGERSRFALYSA